jgi:nucleoside-diphosphate-sugar epimerase
MLPDMSERYVVTGAGGCIGAWVVRRLLDEGEDVVALDLAGASRHRLRQLDADGVASGDCDVTDRAAVVAALDGATRVIHLAGLQIPFCRANPSVGAMVNVVGTVNVFDAVKESGTIRGPVVFASSVAAFAGDDDGTEPRGRAATHYGVYKRANEGNALVYFHDNGIASIGFRPYTVYGVGRDQGVTASPTWAMLAAVRGEPYTLSYSGTSHLQLAEDVAEAFIAASRAPYQGATTLNLSGPCPNVTEIVDAIAAVAPDAQISIDGPELPFPSHLDASAYAGVIGSAEPQTPLAEGVARTIDHLRRLDAAGRLELP